MVQIEQELAPVSLPLKVGGSTQSFTQSSLQLDSVWLAPIDRWIADVQWGAARTSASQPPMPFLAAQPSGKKGERG